MKRASLLGLLALVGTTFLVPAAGSAQQTLDIQLPEWFLKLRLPNGAGKSISTPTGWGAAFNTVFAGGGYQNPVPFDDVDDAVMAAGFGILDPVKWVGLEASFTVIDVSEFGEFTMGAKLHRYLGKGTAIAFGAEHLVENLEADDGTSLDLDPTFYGVISHTFQGMDGNAPGTGRVHMSLGVGNGRFAEKPLRAQAAGLGEDGTYVFGNVAVEAFRNLNLIGEWDGLGLNAGVSYTLPLPGISAGITLGVADITEQSSDQPRFVAGGGFGFSIF